MYKSLSNFILAFLVIFLLIFSTDTLFAQRNFAIYNSYTGAKLSIKEFAESTKNADVVFFGEFHDDSLLHIIQKDYLASIYELNKKTAVSMEMFERDCQSVLDDYMQGKINEEEFLKKCRPWGDYKKFYAPLVELAKANGAPVLAANIPRKYASLYANDGWGAIDRLPSKERGYVADKLNIREDEYQKAFNKVMLSNLGVDTNATLNPNQENTLFLYYGAQCIKDETMAETIVTFLEVNKDFHVVHFTGDFHSNNFLGTVQKTLDRNKDLKIAVISPKYVEAGKEPDFDKSLKNACDYMVILEDKPHEPIPQSQMGGHLSENYIVSHRINVKLNPERRTLEGYDVVRFKNPIMKTSSVKLLKDMQIDGISIPMGPIKYRIEPLKNDSLYNMIVITPSLRELSELRISYKGKVNYSPSITLLNQRHSNTPGIISNAKGEGIYLPGGSFYPQTDKDMADFNVTVSLPNDMTLITSGTISSFKDDGSNKYYNFVSELPTDEFILVGGKYQKIDTIFDGKTFSAFTFEKSPNALTYLNASVDYYKLYTKLFGDYPYKNFSIVENFFATGFGMPGYTLLSNRLMALPFVMLSPGSLAHEFVHNWWGNSVYVDYNFGNWCEALTTFSTNYYYNVLVKKDENALDWRKKALISITNLPEKSNYPVGKFKSQTNNDDATIGYQKGGFIFYEMFKLLGEDRFFSALKSFTQKQKGKRAAWFNLSSAFDDIAKKDSLNIPIRKTMNQWLNAAIIPTLTLSNVKMEKDSLYFEIVQDTAFYSSVPVKIETDKGSSTKYFTIKAKSNKFAAAIDGAIKSVTVDPDYQCLRRLNKWEIPYSFGHVLADNPIIVLPAKSAPDFDSYNKIADMMKESYECEVKTVDDLKEKDWAERSVIVLGCEKNNSFYSNFKGKYPQNFEVNDNELTLNKQKYDVEGNILLMNFAHPKNPDKFASIIFCNNLETPDPLRRLFHYQSYSMLLLSKTKPGRPVADSEIFPDIMDKHELRWEKK